MTDQNPEALHDKAKATKSVVDSNFVNPGTPVAPIAGEKDLTRSTKADGSAKLNAKLFGNDNK